MPEVIADQMPGEGEQGYCFGALTVEQFAEKLCCIVLGIYPHQASVKGMNLCRRLAAAMKTLPIDDPRGERLHEIWDRAADLYYEGDCTQENIEQCVIDLLRECLKLFN